VETGAALAVGVGAVVVVFLIVRQQEQRTAMLIAQKNQQQQQGDGALSFRDGFAVLGTAAATYFGGPSAGAKAAAALAP
jgi:hypothetical protein